MLLPLNILVSFLSIEFCWFRIAYVESVLTTPSEESDSDSLENDPNAFCSELFTPEFYTEALEELDIYLIDESKFESPKLDSSFDSRILDSD